MADKPSVARSTEDAQAVVRSLGTLAENLKSAGDQVEALEAVGSTKNEKQDNIAAITNTEQTISVTYDKTEIQQLTADIKTVADKVDAIIASLQSANILK